MRPSEEDSYFESCIFNFIEGRFPAARPSLQKHLTAALCFQRKSLIYQSTHNQKLAHRRQVEHKPTQGQVKSLLHQVRTRQTPGPGLSISETTRKYTPSVSFSKTDASIPSSQQLHKVLAERGRPAPSVASTGSTMLGETFDYPDPPQSKGRKHLPCPYCAETLEASKLDMERKTNVEWWR